MIHFITGPINSGKSTRLFNIYKGLLSGDGFYNYRCFHNNQYIGQNIVRMSTGENITFSRIKGHIHDGWDEMFQFHDYSFSQKGIEYAENILSKLITDHKIIFLDEVGPVELLGLGFCNSFHSMVNNPADAYVVCRNDCIFDIINTFKVTDYQIDFNSTNDSTYPSISFLD